jgi:hypothetical protein
VHETDSRHGEFDFGGGISEAPDDLKFLLEDQESVPWRRRQWERDHVLRMVMERTNRPRYVKYYDSQRQLLRSMQRGRQHSFIGMMNGDEMDRRPNGRKSMLPTRAGDRSMAFKETFYIRLAIAIGVMYACFHAVYLGEQAPSVTIVTIQTRICILYTNYLLFRSLVGCGTSLTLTTSARIH